MTDFTVPAGTTPLRLDVFLAHTLPSGSRQRVRELMASDGVRVNGRRQPKAALVRSGDVISIHEPEAAAAPTALPANPALKVRLRYEDADLLVVDKPAGMPSHALRLTETDTVANFLVARFPELRAVGRRPGEPGLVHRLDTGTSGLLLVARTSDAYANLRAQFSTHAVIKEYVALVSGDVPTAGEIDTPIGHERKNPRRMRVCTNAASGDTRSPRPALTRYRPVQRFADCTLLAVEIPTGVMHQIRVHLASIGHPIVGDSLYGGPAGPRLMLHARCIRFIHPRTGNPMRIESPLPPAVEAHLRTLRSQSTRRRPRPQPRR